MTAHRHPSPRPAQAGFAHDARCARASAVFTA
jgi:hypothetical protein